MESFSRGSPRDAFILCANPKLGLDWGPFQNTWVANLIVPEDKVMSIYLLALVRSIQNASVPNHSTTDATIRRYAFPDKPAVVEELHGRRNNCGSKEEEESQEKSSFITRKS